MRFSISSVRVALTLLCILFFLTPLTILPVYGASEGDTFRWGNATVYFVITDRFANGDTTNDVNYGRKTDYGSERLNAATFHGGDFKGMLQKAREGYFSELGVDVVWMTDVYEQIHGWMSGSGAINDFPHYGYHGYYPLDYTQIDKNYGTVEEFRELVDTLHAQGIRVMLGANINDPGYPTLLDAIQQGFADKGLTEEQAVEHIKEWSYDSFYANRLNWKGWYDRGWVRMPDENWDENDPLQATLFGLPDFKDESDEPVKIPDFLKRKWKREGKENDPWVNPSARDLRKDTKRSPMQHLIGWIASWVEEFGIDGVRCDIVENSHLYRWKELSQACNEALKRWRTRHPESPAAAWTDSFYMTGDFDHAGIDYKPDYADAGFSSMVNFYFPKHGDLDGIVYTWQAYADSVAAHADWHPFNYLNNSYHRDADMTNMIDCATTFLLSPGVAQIFYGDETGRKLSDARLNVDSDQAFRSDMDWNDVDTTLLAHYRTLGKIRRAHPVIGTGRQKTIDTHTCLRYNEDEKILIAVGIEPGVAIPVGDTFAEGTILTNLYTGEKAKVEQRRIRFQAYPHRLAILTAQ
ncbi:MAG: alpha-amylase family glycosyl hydrolase [Lepagella sp.]